MSISTAAPGIPTVTMTTSCINSQPSATLQMLPSNGGIPTNYTVSYGPSGGAITSAVATPSSNGAATYTFTYGMNVMYAATVMAITCAGNATKSVTIPAFTCKN